MRARSHAKRIVVDYRHYRSVKGESNYYFLIKRPSNLENKIGRRVGLTSLRLQSNLTPALTLPSFPHKRGSVNQMLENVQNTKYLYTKYKRASVLLLSDIHCLLHIHNFISQSFISLSSYTS